ncbi:MAG: VTT domain-containing protein [Acidobacteriota bacterium]|nr:VTT domain-containing protein [Acidobacteriota bacterium]
MNFLNNLSEYLTVLGIPGLFFISFLDSALVPLAGGPDAVILLLAYAADFHFFWIALTATVGSTLGNMILYGIGHKSGEKALARFNPDRVAQIEQKMQVYGAWAVFGSVLAPPPFPTKLVILAAGVLKTGKIRFAASVFSGRLVRYSLVAWLAAKFGSRAAEIIKENTIAAACVLVVVLLLALGISKWRDRRSYCKRQGNEGAPPESA